MKIIIRIIQRSADLVMCQIYFQQKVFFVTTDSYSHRHMCTQVLNFSVLACRFIRHTIPPKKQNAISSYIFVSKGTYCAKNPTCWSKSSFNSEQAPCLSTESARQAFNALHHLHSHMSLHTNTHRGMLAICFRAPKLTSKCQMSG